MAREAGLDLVEVAAKERPPVCKIMDYGKFKYAQSKKSHQKTHQQKLKEIRVRPKTGDHDVETKIQPGQASSWSTTTRCRSTCCFADARCSTSRKGTGS